MASRDIFDLRNMSPSNMMTSRQRRPSLMLLSLSESLFTMDSIVDSYQSKSTYISEDNVSSDCDKSCCDVTNRRQFERSDLRGGAFELSKKFDPIGMEEKEIQGRSIVEPKTIWPDFRSADTNHCYITSTWAQLHRTGESHMTALLRQLAKK
uniref:Uncharacterized protein n=1 Tax=Ciona savignyi TaxID=51511 RepID=H2YM91_CIOSA